MIKYTNFFSIIRRFNQFSNYDAMGYPPKMIPELREKARYEISDDCPTPMFTANDISLQNIDGTDLFVVQLDATSTNGYLRKELPQCGAANNIALRPHREGIKIKKKKRFY